MNCQNCQSQEFFENDIGSLICVFCGVEAADVLIEELSEDEKIGMGGRRETRIRGSRVRADEELASADDLLEVHQYCLQLFAHKVHKLAPDLGSKFMQIVEDVWFRYIEKVTPLKHEIIAMKNVSSRTPWIDRKDNKKRELVEGVPRPSKFLFMGLIYLVCRMQRHWIIPSTLARWCIDGSIPYLALWEAIPLTIKSKLTRRKSYVYNPYITFFNSEHLSSTMMPTPHNILFHANFLADYLHISIPPLNAPLVARCLCIQLGLPDEVWNLYARISNLVTHEQPLDYLDPIGEHQSERVMAALLVATKLSHRWMEWCLEQNTNENTPHDATSTAIYSSIDVMLPDLLHRQDLLKYLDKVKATVKASPLAFNRLNQDESRGFNRAVAQLLGDFPDLQLNHLATDEGHARHDPTYLKPPQYGERSLPEALARLSARSRLQLQDNHDCNNNDNCRPYLSYIDTGDHTGTLHGEYMALIERCAKHILCAPVILHALVEDVDGQLASIADEDSTNIDQGFNCNVESGAQYRRGQHIRPTLSEDEIYLRRAAERMYQTMGQQLKRGREEEFQESKGDQEDEGSNANVDDEYPRLVVPLP